MEYHKDKNGVEIKYTRGYALRDDKGEYFELFGTGLKISDRVQLWDKNNKMAARKEEEIEIVMTEDEEAMLWSTLIGVSIFACIMIISWISS